MSESPGRATDDVEKGWYRLSGEKENDIIGQRADIVCLQNSQQLLLHSIHSSSVSYDLQKQITKVTLRYTVIMLIKLSAWYRTDTPQTSRKLLSQSSSRSESSSAQNQVNLSKSKTASLYYLLKILMLNIFPSLNNATPCNLRTRFSLLGIQLSSSSLRGLSKRCR